MAHDPARAQKWGFQELRRLELEGCREAPCTRVHHILNSGKKSMPPCKICVHEKTIKRIAIERGW